MGGQGWKGENRHQLGKGGPGDDKAGAKITIRKRKNDNSSSKPSPDPRHRALEKGKPKNDTS